MTKTGKKSQKIVTEEDVDLAIEKAQCVLDKLQDELTEYGYEVSDEAASDEECRVDKPEETVCHMCDRSFLNKDKALCIEIRNPDSEEDDNDWSFRWICLDRLACNRRRLKNYEKKQAEELARLNRIVRNLKTCIMVKADS